VLRAEPQAVQDLRVVVRVPRGPVGRVLVGRIQHCVLAGMHGHPHPRPADLPADGFQFIGMDILPRQPLRQTRSEGYQVRGYPEKPDAVPDVIPDQSFQGIEVVAYQGKEQLLAGIPHRAASHAASVHAQRQTGVSDAHADLRPCLPFMAGVRRFMAAYPFEGPPGLTGAPEPRGV